MADATHTASRAAGALSDAPAPSPGVVQLRRLLLRNPIGLLGAIIVALVIVVAILADLLAPVDPTSQLAQPLQPPGGSYALGTDELGRDVLSRVIHGSRVSLYVGIVSVSIALVSGSVLGLLAGYYGGKLDMVIMRLMD